MRFRIIITLFALLAGALPASGQPSPIYEDWRWTKFTVDDGLPSNHIYSIHRRTVNITWAVTAAGLAWFDGYQWHRFDPGVPVVPESVVVVYEDERHDLHISSPGDRGIYAIMNNTLYRCTPESATAIYTPALDAAVLPGTPHRSMLIYTGDSLVHSYGKAEWEPFPLPPGRADNRSPTTHLFTATDGTVWMNWSDGLYRLDGEQWNMVLPSSSRQGLSINGISAYNNGEGGELSIKSPPSMRGLWVWSKGISPRRVPHEEGDRLVAIDHDIALSSTGTLYSHAKDNWVKIDPAPSPAKHATSLRKRLNGDVWIGTTDGLALFDARRELWSMDPLPPPALNRVHEIVRRSNGDLWLGTADGLVIWKPRQPSEVEQQPGRLVNSILGRPILDITGIAEDTAGTMWISSGSAFEGAYAMDNSGRWRHVPIGKPEEPGRFHRIKKDDDGNLWFLGIPTTSQKERSAGPGVYRYDYATFHHLGPQDGLLSGYVYSFAPGGDGSLWFGTSLGLSCRKNGRWLYWRGGTEIPLRNVFALVMDKRNNLWMADREHGIVRLDQAGNIQHYTRQDGLADDRVWEITVDEQGGVWAATAAGVSRFADSTWITYGEETGLKTTALWPILVTPRAVYAGTLGGGLAILDSAETAVQEPTPRIAAGTRTINGASASLTWQAFGWQGMPHSKDIITRYRLNDGQWSSWGLHREAEFHDLIPGEHTITIQAKNLYGEYSWPGTIVHISITAPFYQSPVFIAVSVTAVLALAGGIVLLLRRHHRPR